MLLNYDFRRTNDSEGSVSTISNLWTNSLHRQHPLTSDCYRHRSSEGDTASSRPRLTALPLGRPHRNQELCRTHGPRRVHDATNDEEPVKRSAHESRYSKFDGQHSAVDNERSNFAIKDSKLESQYSHFDTQRTVSTQLGGDDDDATYCHSLAAALVKGHHEGTRRTLVSSSDPHDNDISSTRMSTRSSTRMSTTRSSTRMSTRCPTRQY